MKSSFFLKPEFKIGSHRGIQESSKISQNSIESLELMHKKKADFYECDIVMTLDEKIICFHDKKWNGKPINTYTFNKLPKHIPTLELFIQAHQNVMMGLYIELKFYEQDRKRKQLLVKKTIDIMKRYHLEQHVLIVSFDPILLDYAYKENPRLYLGLNIDFQDKECNFLSKNIKNLSIFNYIQCLCPHIDQLDLVKDFHFPLYIWEKSKEEKLSLLFQSMKTMKDVEQWIQTHHIFGIITNTVTAIQQKIHRLKNKSQ